MCTPRQVTHVIQLTVNHTLTVENDLLSTPTYIVSCSSLDQNVA